MPSFTAYRLLSYVLLPVAFFIGATLLMVLPMAIANPGMLLMVFMLGSLLIYTFTSLRFLHRGLLRRHMLPQSLKDWIKVNGYVTIVFSVMALANCYKLLSEPSMLNQIAETQAEMFTTNAVATGDMLRKGLYVFMAYAFCLLVHLGVTFVLMQKYAYLFVAPQDRR